MLGPPTTQRNKANFLKIYASNLGDISASCRKSRVGRTTYYKWLKKDPDFRKRVAMADEDVKDWAESQLKILMQGIPYRDKETGRITGWKTRPDTAAIIFFNKTINKDRGYIERTEHSQVQGVQIVVKSQDDAALVQRVSEIAQN